MNARGRIGTVLLVLLAYALTLRVGQIFRVWLAPALESACLARSVSVFVFAVLWMLPFLHPRLRGNTRLHNFRPTWVLLLALPYPLMNVMFSHIPLADRSWEETACLVWFALSIGLFEELLFRGYALLRPESHPRFAILVSSVAFALVHWLGGHSPLALLPTFSFGISFGIVRVVSGSLVWCIVLHAATNVAAGVFTPHHGTTSIGLYLIVGAAALITLLKHPRLNPQPPTPHSVPE